MRHIFTLSAAAIALTATAGAHEVIHGGHDHQHEVDCGHQAVEHNGHVDYLHDGHLHHAHGMHADEHVIEVSSANPAAHGVAAMVGHREGEHTADDGRDMVQHGDHFDHLHKGRLHHIHGDHVDDHGPLKTAG